MIKNTIQVTTDYKKFHDIRGNRPINQPHVREVANSIALKDLTPYLPIIVNEQFDIIDGQHRFEGCVRQGKPIYYIVVPNLKLADVQMLNSTARRWALIDYINSHIELGNDEYRKLLDFMTQHSLSASISVLLLTNNAGGTITGGSSAGRAVREGYFKVTHPEGAELIARVIEELDAFAEFDTRKERNFIAALVNLMSTSQFTLDRLMFKLKENNGLRIMLQPTTRHYVLEIERVYNFNAMKKVDLFTGQTSNSYGTSKPKADKASKAAK